MNSTPLNIMVVNGNEIISSSELPPQGQAIYIKAAKGQKYLITQGKDGAAPEHITVKRVGDDLQVFTGEGAEQPDLIIEDFYTQQGELAGMAEDGTYHTYAAAGDGEAFSMLEDGASATLLLSNTATTGLVGLGAAGGLLAGMSAGMLAVGALAAVAAITGVAVAVKNSNDKGSDHHDNTPPQPGDLSIRDGNGKDMSQGGDFNTSPLVFSGTGRPGDTAIVYDGDKPIAEVVIGDDGKWTIPVTLPEDGQQHDLSVGFKDPQGNEGPRTEPVGVGYDTTPPATPDPADMTIVDGDGKDLSAGGDSKSNPIDFRGENATPGDTVIVYDGDKPIGSVIVGDDGRWHIPVTLPEDGQQHDLSVGIKDPVGNESERTPPVGIGYDGTPPEMVSDLTIRDGNGKDMGLGGETNKNPIDFSGKAEPGSTVIVYDGDKPVGSVIVGQDGSWHIPVTLPEDGQKHDLSVGVTDPAGNESGRTPGVGIGYDATPPTAPNPADMTIVDSDGKDLSSGGGSKSNPIDFRGDNATPGDTVIVYDGDTPVGSVIVGEDGSWHIPVTLPEDGQDHELSVGIQDPVGNESNRTTPVGIEYDTTPPVKPVISEVTDISGAITDPLVNGSLTDEKQPVFSGKSNESGLLVELVDQKGNVVGTAVTDTDGNWSVKPDIPLNDGTWQLIIRLTDKADNSAVSDPFNLNIDSSIPVAPVVNSVNDNAGGVDVALTTGDLTGDITPTFTGDGPANGFVNITDNYGGSYQVSVDGAGKWEWTPSPALNAGDYEFTLQSQNEIGVLNPATARFDLIVRESSLEELSNFKGGDQPTSGTPFNGWTLEFTSSNGSSLTVQENAPRPGMTGKILTATNYGNGGANVTIDVAMILDNPAIKTSMKIFGVDNSGVAVRVYDTEGNLLHDETIRNGSSTTDFSYQAETGKLIGRVEFSSNGESGGYDIGNIQIIHASPEDMTAAGITGINSIEESFFDLTGHELLLNHDEAVLDLSKVADQVQDVNSVSLEGHGANTLNISINDVLTLGKEDLYFQDGSKQLMINGDKEDIVNLESINGDKGIESWNELGEVNVNGTVYNVYQRDNHDVELLIQQGIQIQQQ